MDNAREPHHLISMFSESDALTFHVIVGCHYMIVRLFSRFPKHSGNWKYNTVSFQISGFRKPGDLSENMETKCSAVQR